MLSHHDIKTKSLQAQNKTNKKKYEHRTQILSNYVYFVIYQYSISRKKVCVCVCVCANAKWLQK